VEIPAANVLLVDTSELFQKQFRSFKKSRNDPLRISSALTFPLEFRLVQHRALAKTEPISGVLQSMNLEVSENVMTIPTEFEVVF